MYPAPPCAPDPTGPVSLCPRQVPRPLYASLTPKGPVSLCPRPILCPSYSAWSGVPLSSQCTPPDHVFF